MKNLGEYHNLHVQGNTLLLADAFENFRNMCIKLYELDPAKLSSSSWISMAGSFFKKTNVKSDLLSEIVMLLRAEKSITGGICHSKSQYAKEDNKYMKDYNKNKEMLYLQYWDVNNLYVWAMSQKLPVNNFE